jgi:hypothetical protein
VLAVFPLAPAGFSIGLFAVGLFALLITLLLLALRGAWIYTLGALMERLASAKVPLPGRHDLHPLRFLHDYNVAVQNDITAKIEKSQAVAGNLFHGFAIIIEWVAREVAATATDVLHWGQSLQRVKLPRLTRAMIIAAFPLPWLTRRVAAIVAAHLPHIARLPRVKWRGLTRTQVAAMIAAAAGTLVTHLPGKTIYQRIREESKPEGFTKRRLRRLEKLLGATGAVALTTMAFRHMGLDWLRCKSLSKLGRRIGCGGFGVMEMFLGGTMEAFILSDLCRFTNLLTATTEKLRPSLLALVDVEQALISCPGNSAPALLHMPPLDIPPLVNESVLAA